MNEIFIFIKNNLKTKMDKKKKFNKQFQVSKDMSW